MNFLIKFPWLMLLLCFFGCSDAEAPNAPTPEQNTNNVAPISRCLVDNGGCNAAYTLCEDTGAESVVCNDIDECKVDNGGCGEPKFFECANF